MCDVGTQPQAPSKEEAHNSCAGCSNASWNVGDGQEVEFWRKGSGGTDCGRTVKGDQGRSDLHVCIRKGDSTRELPGG